MGSIINFFMAIPTVDVPSLGRGWGGGLDLLIKALANGTGSVAWAIILFTLIIKVALYPLDYFSRRAGKKNAVKMKYLQPQIEKIQKQYAGNKQAIQQQTMALYKREGHSMYAMMAPCLPQIVTMVLFFYIFASFRNFANYNNAVVYNQLVEAYNGAIGGGQEAATLAVQKVYAESQQSFLWVQNVWRPDTWASIFPNVAEFSSGKYGLNGIEVLEKEYSAIYNSVEPILKRNNKWNGFMLLPIIAGGVTFLSQWLMRKQQKDEMQAPGQTDQSKMMMKMMMFMMPAMFIIFAFTSSTAFTLYMISNAVYSLGINTFNTWLINKQSKNWKSKKEDKYKTSYMR